MSNDLPFKDLKIIELATVLAGPSVGMFFAELGADVLKIENLDSGGDITRSWRLAGETNQISAYFSSINYKKKYLDKNLKNAADLADVHELLAEADILLTNFKAGDAEKFGLDYETLHQKNSKLIVGTIAGFAQQPERVAYDVVLQAETGFMHINGFGPEQNNLKMPVAMMDMLAAHQLKEGILTALYARQTSGLGSYVVAYLDKSGISALANQASNYLMTGQEPTAMGSLHPNIAPYGDSFLCADGKRIVLAVGSNAQFLKLCSILGEADLANHPKLQTNALRLKNREFLAEKLSVLFTPKNSDLLLAEFHKNQIPAGEIKRVSEVLASSTAQTMICEEIIDGQNTSRVSSLGFEVFGD